jgi:N-acetylglucosaminyldiphosphoundecaprenol N-acetyl-beta-D-mannosaminyltransferase
MGLTMAKPCEVDRPRVQEQGRSQVMSDWNRRSVAVLGVPFDNVTMREALDVIEEKIEERGFHQVATANLDFAINAIHDQSLQEMLCSCDLIVPDGMPIVWASHLIGAKLKERVSGIDLIPRLAELASRRHYGIYLLGASERSSRRAAEVLKTRFPKLHIVGRDSPPLTSLSEMDHEMILRRIEQAQPDVLLVAMGHPKQERWLAMHRHRLKVPLCMGVGASLDFLAGEFSRAPIWMQTAGLEWLYRAAQEPRRLARRYLVDAYGLARHLPAQVAANAIQPRRGKKPTVLTDRQGNASVISISGNLTGSLVTEFEQQLDEAYQEDRHIVLDLAKTTYFGLDSLGLLVHLAKKMNDRERQLWLTAAPPHVIRVFRAARMHGYFGTTSTVGDALYRVRKSETPLASQTIVVHSFTSPARDKYVQVEMLKDLCRKIVFFSQATKLGTGRPSTNSSATR